MIISFLELEIMREKVKVLFNRNSKFRFNILINVLDTISLFLSIFLIEPSLFYLHFEYLLLYIPILYWLFFFNACTLLKGEIYARKILLKTLIAYMYYTLKWCICIRFNFKRNYHKLAHTTPWILKTYWFFSQKKLIVSKIDGSH